MATTMSPVPARVLTISPSPDGAQCTKHVNPFHQVGCRDCDADYLYHKLRNDAAYQLFSDVGERRAWLEPPLLLSPRSTPPAPDHLYGCPRRAPEPGGSPRPGFRCHCPEIRAEHAALAGTPVIQAFRDLFQAVNDADLEGLIDVDRTPAITASLEAVRQVLGDIDGPR